jgi:hypothetical protein
MVWLLEKIQYLCELILRLIDFILLRTEILIYKLYNWRI